MKITIDPRLKPGKDYPRDLPILIDLFRNPLPWGQILRKSITKRELEEYHQLLRPEEIEKIPKSQRKQYVGKIQEQFDKGPDTIALHELKKEASSIEKVFVDYFFADSQKILHACIERVNRKLEDIHPMLSKGEGKSRRLIFDFAVTKSFSWQKGLGLNRIYWVILARIMTELDRALVHRCPECRTIFISKKKNKYDSFKCRKNFLSRKAVETGFAKRRQREYRRRLKKKSKTRQAI
jgi:hypothetical protein